MRIELFLFPRQSNTLALLIALCSGSSALAQRPQPLLQSGSLRGLVVDDSGRGVNRAEVMLPALNLNVLTDQRGQFQFAQIPTGEWVIKARAIGFYPESLAVKIGAEKTSAVSLTLHPSPVLLPEMVATGRIPAPAFGLGFPTTVDVQRYCRGCDLSRRFLPAGASMTDDGLNAVLAWASPRDTVPVVTYYEWPIVGDQGPWGHGIVCLRDHKARLLATRFDSDRATIRILYSDGMVWTHRIRPTSQQGCIGSSLLFFHRTTLGATGTEWGWIVVVEDQDRSPIMVALTDFGEHLWSVPIRTVFAKEKSLERFVLSPLHGGATVAMLDHPFSWAVVDSSGSVILRSSPSSGNGMETLPAEAADGSWKGYAVLPVKDGFVQTLESIRSNDGRFVLYDILGRPVKVMRRAGASVLVASAPDMRMILGYLYKDPGRRRATLFMYRY